MKKIYKLFLIIVFIIIFQFNGFSEKSNKAKTDEPVLKITGTFWPPYQNINIKTKEVNGFATEIVEAILKKLNIKWYIKFFLWEKAYELTEDGTYDCIFSMSYKKYRAKKFIYPKEPLHDSQYVFFIRKKDKKKIKFNTFSDLDNLRIGRVQGYTYSSDFLEYCNTHKDVSVVISDPAGFGYLDSNHIDVFACEKFNGSAVLIYKESLFNPENFDFLIKPFVKKDYFIVASKKSKFPNIKELLDKFDKILREMKKSGEYQKIEQKYNIKRLKY